MASKFCDHVHEILESIIPPIGNYRSNRKINLNEISPEFVDAVGNESITTETLKERYLDTLKIKDKLEDKAKINGAGITISITLIMGATNFLSSIATKFANPVVTWISFIVFILSVIYMIVAGILSFQILMNGNRIGVIKLDTCGSKIKYREQLCNSISYNQKYNTIRNNYIFSSYQCIRNAIILLVVVFIVCVVPVTIPQTPSLQADMIVSANEDYSFFYAPNAMSNMPENEVRNQLENTIALFVEEGSTKISESLSVGLKINAINYFIRFRLTDERTINILEIEPYFCR